MGTWGPGHFDSDTAADHLSIVTKRLIDEVAEAMNGDPSTFTDDEYVGVSPTPKKTPQKARGRGAP